MNGFEQIKSFYSWVFNNPDKIRPTHISLYLFLLNQNNRSMWVEWFKCPYDLAMQGACIGNKNTYYKCLDDLQTYNLIKYKKGINNYKAPLIKLIRLYDSEPLTEQVTVPQSEPQTVPLSVPLSVPLHKNIYKLITDNYITINSKQKKVCDFILDLLNEEKKIFNFRKELIDFGFDEKLVVDWMKVRKTKKATNSETALNSFKKEIQKRNCDINKILEFIVVKSWSGFKWTWYDSEIKKETNINGNQVPQKTFSTNR